MTEEFYTGQIFEGVYPPGAADWCNEQGDCFIEEIEPLDDLRRFQIKEAAAPTTEELRLCKIAEIKAELDEIDLKSIRAMRAGESEYVELYEAEATKLRARLEELE